VVHENIQMFWTALLSSGRVIWSWLFWNFKILQYINKCVYHENASWTEHVLDLIGQKRLVKNILSVFFDILPSIDIFLDNRHIKSDHDCWKIRAELYIGTYV